ncbi:hypothetical protein B0H16DRAFT_1737629 [Mycena metata]|uniref:Uncharacterized protein n=1 Tax=Mycena metata TaxID=1033252 RepID=A0AAD7HK46_9AGAR|nr:hypothetical protein B0H16DRAFT_1737629 [Mycena metata]
MPRSPEDKIYRLYIVWNRTKASYHPTGTRRDWVHRVCGRPIFDSKKLGSAAAVMSLTGFLFTLATNIYCTFGICWKIHTVTRACMPEGGSNLRDLLAMLVESSALYTSWALFYAITHQINDNSQLFAIATLPPIAGIANALLYTRDRPG